MSRKCLVNLLVNVRITTHSSSINENLSSPTAVERPSSPTTIICDDDSSIDYFQSDAQIKNQICGEIHSVLKETELVYKIIDSASDENVNLKNFVTETKACFVKL